MGKGKRKARKGKAPKDKVRSEEKEDGKKRLRGMRKKRFERLVFAVIMIALVTVIIVAPAIILTSSIGPMADPSQKGTYIFYDGACTYCGPYAVNNYATWAKDIGAPKVHLKNTAGDQAQKYRQERNLFEEHWEVPEALFEGAEPKNSPGSVVVYVVSDITTIFIGDATEDQFKGIMSAQNQTRFSLSTDMVIFFQDEYGPWDKVDYGLWGAKGPPMEYATGTPISEYMDYFEAGGKDEPIPPKYVFEPKGEEEFSWAFLALVTITALGDGINPCAIAILIFFITFLYTSKESRAKVMMMGTIYIMAVYTIYFLIGLGLFAALATLEAGFIITTIGAVVMIVLGLISMRDYLFPHLPITVEVPYSLRERITKMIHTATLPTTLVIGLLIGAYTFPCSGGPYVVIIGLLADRTNFFLGLPYLLWYNLWFVMPLLIILAVAANKALAERIKEWEYKTSRKLRAFSGFVMVALGIFILIWYVLVKFMGVHFL